MKNTVRLSCLLPLLLAALTVTGASTAHANECDSTFARGGLFIRDAAPDDLFGYDTNRLHAAPLEAGLRMAFGCGAAPLVLQLDLGATIENDIARPKRLDRFDAGAPFDYGSQPAGVSGEPRSTMRGYVGAALVNADFRPIAIKVRWQSDKGTLKTLLSAGIHLFATETLELALTFAQLEETDDARQRPVLRFTGEF
jgi:hypothetical protein